MTLQQLIDQLQELKSEHGENIDVEFTIPAHEGSNESDYGATEVTEAEVLEMTWKQEKLNILHLTLQ